jgi:hypothetical protein
VLSGAQDPLYDSTAAMDFWRAALPGARLTLLADAGRWLHLTHVEAIVSALAALRQR